MFTRYLNLTGSNEEGGLQTQLILPNHPLAQSCAKNKYRIVA